MTPLIIELHSDVLLTCKDWTLVTASIAGLVLLSEHRFTVHVCFLIAHYELKVS